MVDVFNSLITRKVFIFKVAVNPNQMAFNLLLYFNFGVELRFNAYTESGAGVNCVRFELNG